MLRLLNEVRKQAIVSGGMAEDVFGQIVGLGWGGVDLSCEARESEPCPQGADKPSFNKDTFELFARGRRLHTFATNAYNLLRILMAFQHRLGA